MKFMKNAYKVFIKRLKNHKKGKSFALILIVMSLDLIIKMNFKSIDSCSDTAANK